MWNRQREKLFIWDQQGNAKNLPQDVKDLFSYALTLAASGGEHEDAKPLKGFGGRSVMEVVADYRENTFREVYTVQFKEVVYVLHIFQKKSKKGIATPKQDVDLIKQRLKWAKALHKDKYEKKKTK